MDKFTMEEYEKGKTGTYETGRNIVEESQVVLTKAEFTKPNPVFSEELLGLCKQAEEQDNVRLFSTVILEEVMEIYRESQ